MFQKLSFSPFSNVNCLFSLQKIGEVVTEDQLHEILREVDLNKNAQVDMGEFLQVSHSYTGNNGNKQYTGNNGNKQYTGNNRRHGRIPTGESFIHR